MKNKKAVIHRRAEEKRAMVMAQRGEVPRHRDSPKEISWVLWSIRKRLKLMIRAREVIWPHVQVICFFARCRYMVLFTHTM
jgi:hypothetical protein